MQRNRQYDDEVQRLDRRHPTNAPDWTYVIQDDMLFDTDIEQSASVEERVVEEVIDVGCSAASSNKDEIDSDYLEMDDGYEYFEPTLKPTPSRDSQKRRRKQH